MFTLEQKIDIALRYMVVDSMTEMMKLKDMAKEALKSGESAESTENPEPILYDVDDMIADLLKELGVPPHLKGHDQACTAIKLCLSDREYLECITSRLYPDIAVRHGTTSSRVERAIRHAVETAFDRCDPDTIANAFGNTISANKGKITNSEFFAHCTKEIARRMKYVKHLSV